MILFFCLLLLLAFPVYAGEISESADNLCIASVEEYVNVRKKPSAESDLVGKMYHYGVGRVLATKETDDGVWYRIRSGDVSGYISSDFLATGEEAEALLPDASITVAQVIPAELTVYDEPSDTGNMLAVVNESTFLDVLDSTGPIPSGFDSYDPDSSALDASTDESVEMPDGNTSGSSSSDGSMSVDSTSDSNTSDGSTSGSSTSDSNTSDGSASDNNTSDSNTSGSSTSDSWTQIVTPYQIEGWVRTDQLRFSKVYSYAETTAQEEERLRQQAEADEAAAIEKEQWDLAQAALGESDETHVGVMEASMAQDEAREEFLSSGGTQEEAEAIEQEILGTGEQEALETGGQEIPGTGEQESLETGEQEIPGTDGQESLETGEQEIPGTDEPGTLETDESEIRETEEDTASPEKANEPEYVRTYRAAVENVLQARQALEAEQAKTDAVIARAQRASVTASAAERVAIEAARKAPRGAAGCEFTTQRDHTIYYLPSLGEELVSYAAQFVGNPYVWGGESLTNGCDCSGFTMLVYARYGIELPHYTVTQATFGTPISEEDLQPGDLVFFERGNYIYHVAIYIGNETIIHAAGTGSGICFSNLHYSTANLLFRRLLKQ